MSLRVWILWQALKLKAWCSIFCDITARCCRVLYVRTWHWFGWPVVGCRRPAGNGVADEQQQHVGVCCGESTVWFGPDEWLQRELREVAGLLQQQDGAMEQQQQQQPRDLYRLRGRQVKAASPEDAGDKPTWPHAVAVQVGSRMYVRPAREVRNSGVMLSEIVAAMPQMAPWNGYLLKLDLVSGCFAAPGDGTEAGAAEPMFAQLQRAGAMLVGNVIGVETALRAACLPCDAEAVARARLVVVDGMANEFVLRGGAEFVELCERGRILRKVA
jgi:hypothetical protein